ncbi:kinesin-like protein KIF28P isoform X3 [Branchiostoma floridae]|uniref:Kinesin-like protein 6 n=1 Tax=Branchiostoma floridae TaxID=7739 RepID=A0A9J7LD60_BRAFL|nr:kinesin-like protein KIF28P isoform X3 [Branchiostoma floridae]
MADQLELPHQPNRRGSVVQEIARRRRESYHQQQLLQGYREKPTSARVKVAVRCRPFNQREKDRGAKLIIDMNGAMTTIQNPETPNEEPKKFTFDFSYWSHDGYTEKDDGYLEANPGSKYSSQRRVFDDLGQGVLDNAFKGFNCSLFAYGQTGSGKSYSMVGYGNNKGIVPITCDELFKAIEAGDKATKYEVTFSMLEIYNEQVRDLLSKDNPKGGLQVRQNPKLGLFYVVGLKKVAVGSYAEIDKRTQEGTANRTVASTNMNATSSRAHTVVTITFDQISKNEAGEETKKSSVINLVDLAGSERADSTGATGDRLKEGANINKSLSALGNVISALADLSSGGKKKVMVPYRDSVLTKLLQNALGGNSKTVMIAALSPADINYDETLSTLRYADRAKKIKNKAVVNENPLDKLIRELREENEKLKKQMGGAMPVAGGAGMDAADGAYSKEEIERMRKEMEEEIRAQLLANQEQMKDMDESFEDKLKRNREEQEAMGAAQANTQDRKSKDPHLVNLNEDPMLSGVIFHFIEPGEMTIGRKDANPPPMIQLTGLSISKQHAVITFENSEATIKPGEQGAKTKINGVPLTGPTTLQHLDRVLFGSNHMYVFHNPLNPKAPENTPSKIDWDFAQKEIAKHKGFDTASAGMSKEQIIAQEQILELLPMVSEVNAISEELNKHRTFEVILISGAAMEGYGSKKGAKVVVKMKNLLNGNTWLWERGKFMNRRYMIQELYQRHLDGDEDVMKIPKEEDPFWEPPEDVLIGTANVFLQSLSYALDFDDKLSVTDYKGVEEGNLYVNITPCSDKGKPLDEDFFVEDPQELLGKPFHYKVTIKSAEVNKAKYSKGLHVKYKVYQDDDFTSTPVIKATLSPEFKHHRIITYPAVNEDQLGYFEHGCITFQLYGVQEDSVNDNRLMKMTTKELRQMEQLQTPGMQRRQTISEASEESKLRNELDVLRKKFERLEKKEKRIQDLCSEWKSKPAEEQQFEPFWRHVSAVANSSGNKLKTRVEILNTDDLVSVYSFELDPNAKEQIHIANNSPRAKRNGGLGTGSSDSPNVIQAQNKSQEAGGAQNGSNGSINSGAGSKACVIQ